MGRQFDELSKALASGQSRRTALRRFAAGVAGTVLATFIPGQAAEASGSFTGVLRDCSRLCLEEFRPGTRAFSRCAEKCVLCTIKGGQYYVGNGQPFCLKRAPA